MPITRQLIINFCYPASPKITIHKLNHRITAEGGVHTHQILKGVVANMHTANNYTELESDHEVIIESSCPNITQSVLTQFIII